METVAKLCRGCKLPLPLSEFYERKGGGHISECKECMKLRSDNALSLDPLEPRAATETFAIKYLHRNRIPALPGKAVSYKHVDVVAWGCILIEVKYSKLEFRRGVEQFVFNTTPSQQKNGFKADVVILICDYGDKKTYHLFDAKHEVFYMKDRLKTGFTFTPEAKEAKKHGNNRVVMTQPLMDDAEDDLFIIQEKLDDYCEKIALE